ncbi:response regulator [Ramlibacter sp. AW1]|uniref:histidine kinase n=1 Tax=Ramlibacter aurantiacus TaxID=2801330 RepID=A0A936ZM88_9BURK|nr:ATP-binding protein [Ramlibacter aurantiacus]MBL0419860.1 response regulator [Ramlibacter aurantiacus]
MSHAFAPWLYTFSSAAVALSKPGESLEGSLERCLQACLPVLADWIVLDVPDREPGLRLAAAHQAPEVAAALATCPWSPPDARLEVCAMASGQRILREGISPAEHLRLRKAAQPHVRLLGELGVGALLSLPIRVGKRLSGALTLCRASARHRFSAGELEHANRVATLVAGRLSAEWADQCARERSDFLARLGHELRNPLAPIVSALELIDRRQPSLLVAERAVIRRQVAHLSRLVDDLLDVSRLSRGELTLRRAPVDLREVVADALDLAAAAFHGRTAPRTQLPDEATWVDGDATRLAQAIAQLLQNAARFTPASGSVSLRLYEQGTQACVEVEDSGCGIAPELLPHLFEPFVQARQPSDRKTGGLGLGLCIVRGVMQLHGGTVQTASAGPGEGARFTMRLPVSAAATLLPAAPPPASAQRPLRILVVDDNRDAAEMLAELLSLIGHDCHIAEDASDALAQLAGFDPELALLDIGLPRVDGLELARILRGRPESAGLHLVALTGYGTPSDRSRALRAGFDEHLVKPVLLDDLLAVISRLTGRPAEILGERPLEPVLPVLPEVGSFASV